MQAVLQLSFDKETDALFRSLWQGIKDAGLPSPMLEKPATPHITLSFGDGVDVGSLTGALSQTLADKSSLELVFAALGTFANEKGVVFAAPVVTTNLLALHRQVQGCMHKHAGSTSAYSEVDRWVPHCTLTMHLTPSEVRKSFELLAELRLPISALGTQVRLLEFPSLEELASWHLTDVA